MGIPWQSAARKNHHIASPAWTQLHESYSAAMEIMISVPQHRNSSTEPPIDISFFASNFSHIITST